MLRNKPYIILFSGYSVNNTPKLKNLINSLKDEGCRVSLFGIVKDLSHNLVGVNVAHLYSKGDKQGIVKIVIVSYFVLKLIFALVFSLKNSNIYAINPISGIVALISSTFSSKKYIYESHEMVFGLNYPYFRGRWRHFWRFIEKTIIRKSEYFFTTDPYRLRFIRRYYNIKSENVGYILNAPLMCISKAKKEENRNKFNFGSQFVVSYCGGIMKGRGIESIIEAYANFKNKGSHTLLLLAGSIEDDYRKALNKMILKMGINTNEILFTGKLDNSILMQYMSASDATFAIYNNVSLNNRMCSPNKVFDALHSKTYLIASNSFLTANIVSKNNVGVILKTINPQNIVLAIEQCYEKKNNPLNDQNWKAMQLKFCWESEFERVKSHILI
jgi:glycosyltransferase involved in cell wall biosynthesis